MGKREGYGFSFAKIETDWKVGLLFCYTLISGSRKGVAMSKFLSYEDRLIISQRIQENASFGAIAKELGKDRTTIAKEIRKYSYDKKSGRPGYPYNPCKYRNSCKAKKICGANGCTHQSAYKCSLCSECTFHCPDFEEEICSVKRKPPYVYNGCRELPRCTLLKRIYDPADAHEMAHKTISESRTGILSNESDIARINKLITPLVKNGQSLHQIYTEHVDELMCSEKTLYNYVDAQLFEIRNIDLPRKVKYRPRYKQPEFKVDRGCRLGRSYSDFPKFLEKEPETTIVQMDSVIGKPGGKCLLTVHFVETSFMLAFLRESNTAGSVIHIFQALDRILGAKDFNRLFPVILTDNGSEFSNPKEIEYRDTVPMRRTNLFYCDPSCPYQKGACEVNHELIRRILPKGESFDDLTQADISLMMNHINSYKRKKLNNRSPYDAFSFYYGEDLLKKLGCSPVAAENIILKPKLLKK